MDEQQKADLAAAMAESGHPAAEKTSQEVVADVKKAIVSNMETGEPVGTPAEPVVSNGNPSVDKEVPKSPGPPRHEQILQRMMEQAREAREKQAAEKEQRALREQAAYAQKLMQAKEYGKDAVLKAAGVEEKKIDLTQLFGDPKDDTQDADSEVKKQVAKLTEHIQRLEEERDKERQTVEQQQMRVHMQQEVDNIEKFITGNTEKYQFVNATRPMGSGKDLYNGMISMYNQGYSPSYEDMSDLVEARMEEVVKLASSTPKFAQIIEELFGVKLPQNGKESQTLKSSDGGDTPAELNPETKLTDEENRQLALKEAYAAREKLLKKLD